MIFKIFILQNDLKISFIINIISINVILQKEIKNSLFRNINSNLVFRKSFFTYTKTEKKQSNRRGDFRRSCPDSGDRFLPLLRRV